MKRDRSCGALIQGDRILMVQHREGARTFWTLPGGGVEPEETPAAAAERELWEETGCRATAVRLLYSAPRSVGEGTEYCFLMESEAHLLDVPALGIDPEEAHMPQVDRQLQNVGWKSLEEMADDGQVREVLRALRELT